MNRLEFSNIEAGLQEIISSLQSFNRNVSHDLRTPLATIASLAGLANEALLRGDYPMLERVLPVIGTQAHSCIALVESLLHLAQVDGGEICLVDIDLCSLVLDVAEEVSLSEARMPLLSMHSLASLPPVKADHCLLRRVLHNLIANAAKFARACPDPKLEVGGFSSERELTVFVRDNGIGFDASASERIFAPFVRLKDGIEGHGIGLSIVARAVERHGGRVWAESHPGQGACFFFTLPRHAAPPQHYRMA